MRYQWFGSVILSGILLAGSLHAQTLRAVTSADVSPMSRGHGEELPGFNHELVTLMAERAGYGLEIEYYPWKRAQQIATDGDDVLIFGMTRTEKREPLYDWIDQLVDVEWVFVTTDRPIDSYEDASTVGLIGSQGVYTDALVREGLTNFEQSRVEQSLLKLEADRVDAVFTLAQRAIFIWNQLGFPAEDLVSGQPIRTTSLWLAASDGYPEHVMEDLRAALESVRSDGTFEALYEKYFGADPG